MWTKQFWKGTAERVVASIAGAAASAMAGESFGVLEADWTGIASLGLGAGAFALAKALAAGAKDGNPSVTNAELAAPRRAPGT